MHKDSNSLNPFIKRNEAIKPMTHCLNNNLYGLAVTPTVYSTEFGNSSCLKFHCLACDRECFCTFQE